LVARDSMSSGKRRVIPAAVPHVHWELGNCSLRCHERQGDQRERPYLMAGHVPIALARLGSVRGRQPFFSAIFCRSWPSARQMKPMSQVARVKLPSLDFFKNFLKVSKAI